MIPTAAASDTLISDFNVVNDADKTTKTYHMRINEDPKKNQVRYYVDGKNAMQQLIFKTLQTERYDHPNIYSDNFGVEFKDLIGTSSVYAVPEIERRIREALTWDERISDVSDFEFKINKGSIAVDFIAHTKYGDVPVNDVQVGI